MNSLKSQRRHESQTCASSSLTPSRLELFLFQKHTKIASFSALSQFELKKENTQSHLTIVYCSRLPLEHVAKISSTFIM